MFQGDRQLDHTQKLTIDRAMAEARRETGLSDFGDDPFAEALAKLCECAVTELEFTDMGALSFQSTIVRFLVNRLRLQKDLKDHPEILEEDVDDPLVVLGMPRTGTTKLQRMLSADPHNQRLELWRLLNPAPFPGELPGKPEGRLAFAKIVEDATKANPDFLASHETAAREADEDSYLLLNAFDYDMLHNIFTADSFLRWVRSRSGIPAHAYEKKLLQYLQWQDGGRRGRRWVLKNPGAVGHLRAMSETFPKAAFIYSHRSLTEVLPSYCRLMESIYRPLYKKVDPQEVGRQCLLFWGESMRRFAKDRADLAGQLNFMEVPYLDLVRDPLSAIKEFYRRAGVAYTKEGEAGIRAWSAANRQHKFGKAESSLERYGLTEAMIREEFGIGAFAS